MLRPSGLLLTLPATEVLVLFADPPALLTVTELETNDEVTVRDAWVNKLAQERPYRAAYDWMTVRESRG
jgi:hypothetical protein